MTDEIDWKARAEEWEALQNHTADVAAQAVRNHAEAEARAAALKTALQQATQQEFSMARRMRAAVVEARRLLAQTRFNWNGPVLRADGVLAEALSADCPVRPESPTPSLPAPHVPKQEPAAPNAIDWKARAEAAEAERTDYRLRWEAATAASIFRDSRIAELEAALAAEKARAEAAEALAKKWEADAHAHIARTEARDADRIAKLEAALAALPHPAPHVPTQEPGASAWRRIETAPKDGTEVLVWDPGEMDVFIAWGSSGIAWTNARADSDWPKQLYPTHWMPLPAPPVKDTP